MEENNLFDNNIDMPDPYNFKSKELKYFIDELKDFIKDKKSVVYKYYASIIISYPLELIAFSFVRE